jgi:hypothetical protein
MRRARENGKTSLLYPYKQSKQHVFFYKKSVDVQRASKQDERRCLRRKNSRANKTNDHKENLVKFLLIDEKKNLIFFLLQFCLFTNTLISSFVSFTALA